VRMRKGSVAYTESSELSDLKIPSSCRGEKIS
jgi:hypothetical protein